MNEIPRALFEVGEEALVVSRRINPGSILDCIVFRREYCLTESRHFGGHISPPGWMYWINGGANCNHESTLRKKHKPGSSFSQLMADLTNPSHIAEPVKE